MLILFYATKWHHREFCNHFDDVHWSAHFRSASMQWYRKNTVLLWVQGQAEWHKSKIWWNLFEQIVCAPCQYMLTHWGRDKMDAISQRTSSSAFSWMKMFEFRISMNFVPKGPFNKIPPLVQIMAWRRPGNKPLSEPMMVCLTTHICVTRPQWVKETLELMVWLLCRRLWC